MDLASLKDLDLKDIFAKLKSGGLADKKTLIKFGVGFGASVAGIAVAAATAATATAAAAIAATAVVVPAVSFDLGAVS